MCHNCGKLLSSEKKHSKDFYEFMKKKKNPKNRLNAIYKHAKDIVDCGEKDEESGNFVDGCGHQNPKSISRKQLTITMKSRKEGEEGMGQMEEDIDAAKAREILSRISNKDSEMLGFNNERGRPEWMIITRLLVCPPPVRPSVEMSSTMRAEDDLTNAYRNIVKQNNQLQSN